MYGEEPAPQLKSTCYLAGKRPDMLEEKERQKGRTPLHLLMVAANEIIDTDHWQLSDIHSLIMINPKATKIKDNDGNTPLALAVKAAPIAIVRYMIAAWFPVDDQNFSILGDCHFMRNSSLDVTVEMSMSLFGKLKNLSLRGICFVEQDVFLYLLDSIRNNKSITILDLRLTHWSPIG
jgi:ankyrin repeat protein